MPRMVGCPTSYSLMLIILMRTSVSAKGSLAYPWASLILHRPCHPSSMSQRRRLIPIKSRGSLQRKSVECSAHIHRGEGRRCRLRTTVGPYCFIHAPIELGLRVQASDIPGAGNGLFVTRDDRRGQNIADYKGKLETETEFNAQYPHGDPYALQLSRHQVLVPTNSTASYGYYANDPNGPIRHTPRRKPNSRFSVHYRGRTPEVTVKATKNIHGTSQKPAEVFVSYGQAYNWNS